MNSNPKVLAIVGSTYDITGIATCDDAILYDSNPSSVYGNSGGAGRNIAENMARMGLPVGLISAYGTDAFSKEIMETNKSVGMDVSHCYIKEGGKCCMYISLLDKSGELLLAAADLSLMEAMPASYIDENKSFISGFDYVFVDTNLTEEMLIRIARIAKGKLFADTVSEHKATRFLPILDAIDTIKTNRGELAKLSGMKADTLDEIKEAAMSLVNKGLRRVFVTMGPKGSCCCTKDGFVTSESVPAQVKNVTGAGDAFAAATMFGTIHGYSDKDILVLGTAASHIALLAPGAVSTEMSSENLLATFEKVRTQLENM